MRAWLLLGILYSGLVQAKADNQLTILNWAEYMAPEVIQAFEKTYNTQVKVQYYDSDTSRDKIMASTQGLGIDLVVVTGINLDSYIRRQWLAKLDPAVVPNQALIDSRWSAACHSEYAIPYFWGTLGIGYRTDMVSEGFASWMDFFKPQANIQGKIMAVNDPKDLIGAALKALGYSFNSVEKRELKQVTGLLRQFHPSVKSYGYALTENGSGLVSGDLAAAMMYNGDILLLQEQFPETPLAFAIPKEGSVSWTDCIAVTSASQNQALAMKFINFINQPEQAAQQAQYVNYASPNAAATQLLPESFLQNPVIYPPEAIMQRLESYHVHSARDIKTRNELYSNIVQ